MSRNATADAKLDPIWDAVLETADEGSIRGKLDFRDSEDHGTGLLDFQVGGERFTLDLYRSEDVEEARPQVKA